MKKYKYIIWDLDGTLSDPMVGICSAVQYTLKFFNINVEDIRTLTPFIGPPLQHSFKELYGFTPEQISRALVLYDEYFIERGMYENTMYEGIDLLLKKLRESGRHLYVATTKPELLARKILGHFGLLEYFDFVGGDTSDFTRSEKSEIIDYVLESNNISDKNSVVMIGDRKFDIEGAKSNGIDSAGVLYGYGSYDEFVESGADYIVKDLKELEDLLL